MSAEPIRTDAQLEQQVVLLEGEVTALRGMKDQAEQLAAGAAPAGGGSVSDTVPPPTTKPAARRAAPARPRGSSPAKDGRGETVPAIKERVVAVLRHRDGPTASRQPSPARAAARAATRSPRPR